MRRGTLFVIAIAGVGACALGGALAYDAYVPRFVQETSECRALDDGSCVVALVRWHRVLPPDPVLEIRRGSEVVREEPLPRAASLEDSTAPDFYLATLHVPDESEGEWMTREPGDPAPPPADGRSGTCVIARADGRVRFCAEHEGHVEHHVVLPGPIGGRVGGMLVEIRGPAPRSVAAYDLAGHGVVWETPVEARWDPEGSRDRAWLLGYVGADGRVDAAGMRIGERYFSIDLERGAVALASPEDATSVCTEGRFVAASVGAELRVSLVRPLAFRTIATPGPGTIGRCTLEHVVRGEPIVRISWCPPTTEPRSRRAIGEECQRTFEVDSSLALVASGETSLDATLDALLRDL